VNTKRQQITNEVFTLANIVSAIRLALLPVFLIFLIAYKNNLAAFLVLTIAALTDMIDGQLARFTNTVSYLGIQLDPFVDRFFIFLSVIGVYVVKRLPLWLLVLFVLRDAVMFLLTVYMKKKHNRDFKVVLLGKMSTAALMAGFCSLVIYGPMIPGFGLIESSWLPGWGIDPAPLGYLLIYIGAVLSVSSAIYYIYTGVKVPISQADAGNSGVSPETGGPLHSDNRNEPIGKANV